MVAHKKINDLFYFSGHVCIRWSHPKWIDDNVDDCDEKDEDGDDVIEDLSCLDFDLVVDVHPSDDQEEDPNNDLKF